MGGLVEVDALRDERPEAALEAYLAARPEDVLVDGSRLGWILEHLGPVPSEEALPLLSFAAERAEGPTRVEVLHALGVVTWYRGETERAEESWRGALEEARRAPDRALARCHNNLALCLAHRGAYFEALVLFGGAERLAAEEGALGSRVFAICRRGQMLALLGDQARAEAAFDAADALWPQVESPEERGWLESSLLAARARQHRVTGDWRALLEAQDRRLAALGELPEQQHATLANAHTQRLRALAELEPERGEEWIAELESLPERFALEQDWERQRQCELARLRYRVRRRAGETGELLRAPGGELLEAMMDTMRGTELVHELVDSARCFQSVELHDLSRRALDRAATELLRALLEAAESTDAVPELRDATPEDWRIHAESQARLFAEQEELMATVTELWRPGHPAFELVVVDDLVRLCAWCRQLRLRDGRWVPVSGYVPATDEVAVTHGICDGCREVHFASSGAP